MSAKNRSDPVADVEPSAPDQEMASIDPPEAVTPQGEASQATDDSIEVEDDQSVDPFRRIQVDDDDRHEAASHELNAAASGKWRVATRGFEANDGFAFSEQERKAEERLLDERIRERYIQEIGDPFDERGGR